MEGQIWLLLLGVLLLLGISLGRAAQRARDADRTAQLELGGRARRMLLETDDALRSAERELGYARATFGVDEAAGLASAMDAARVAVDAAFALGRQIDDEVPETTDERQAMLDRIVAGCAAARTAVDAQVARIAELRAIAADPDAAIVDAATAITAQAAAIDAAVTEIDGMRARYAASSIRGVVAMPAEALSALTRAQADLERARDAATPSVAAIHVRSANLATARSRELSGAVQRQAALLVASADRLIHLREDSVAAIDAAQLRLDGLAGTTPGTDPAAHELTLAGDRLMAARTSLQAADAALALTPSDVQGATERLTAAIALAGGAANALTSVGVSREGADRAYPTAAALAGEAIAQGEAWLNDGRAPTTEERRIRATLAGARTMLADAGHLAATDPVRASAMAWTARSDAVQATVALDPDHRPPTSHAGHSADREALEQVASEAAGIVGQMLFELAFGGVESISHGSSGAGVGAGRASSSSGF